MADLLLLVSLVIVVLGIGLLRWSRRKRQKIHIPAGKAVYLDSREVPGKTLISHRYQLKRRPDFLMRQGSEIIPVEAKTGRTPREPYLSHVMQRAIGRFREGGGLHPQAHPLGSGLSHPCRIRSRLVGQAACTGVKISPADLCSNFLGSLQMILQIILMNSSLKEMYSKTSTIH